MLTARDIREVRFSKSVGGYKQDEVDALLDTVEEDYESYEVKLAELNSQVVNLQNEIESYKNSQSSLQSILIEAQKLADKTVNDAKEKAALIIGEAKAAADNAAGEAKILLDTFDAKFSEKKAAAQKEYDKDLEEANRKKEAVEKATADAVKREQALFDKTRIEIASFKSEILALYKKQLEIINEMPDCVAMDAIRAAEAVSLKVDEIPNMAQFIEEPVITFEEPEEEIVEESKENGFVFNENALPFEEPQENEVEEDEDNGFFKNGFFRK